MTRRTGIRDVVRVALYLLLSLVVVAFGMNLISGYFREVRLWIPIAVVIAGLAILIPLELSRARSPLTHMPTSPLRAVTTDELLARLDPAGAVNWVDRSVTVLDLLRPPHDSLILTGPMKTGKTREIIELIRRAETDCRVQHDHIYVFDPSIRTMAPETLRVTLASLLDPASCAILLCDDLPYYFSGNGLKLLEVAMEALADCKEGYFLATARDDHLTPEHLAWLRRHQVRVIELPGWTPGQKEALAANSADRFLLELPPDAREALASATDGAPEVIVTSLRRAAVQGVRLIDQTVAREWAQKGVHRLWDEIRRSLGEREPATEPFLRSLATFHAAHVTPYTPLVLHYAAHLWRRDYQLRWPWLAVRRLRRVFVQMHNHGIVEDAGEIVYKDVVVEPLLPDSAAASANLETFLTHHRRAFHNRLLRQLYRDAKLHAGALLDLASLPENPHSASLCRASLRVAPGSMAHINLACFCTEEGGYEEGIAHMTQAMRFLYADAERLREYRSPELLLAVIAVVSHLYLGRGRLYSLLKDYESAIADLTEAIDLSRDDADKADAHCSRARARAKQGDLPGALTDYAEALRLYPDDAGKASVYADRGHARASAGDQEGAIADFTEAIRIHPDDASRASAYDDRGHARAAAGDQEGACADFTEAVLLHPDDAGKAGSLRYRAGACAKQGDLQRALADYAESLRLSPDNAERARIFYERGHTRGAAGDWEGAIADLGEATRLFPSDAEKAVAYAHRAITLATSGDHIRAIADYTEAIRLYPAGAQKAAAYEHCATMRIESGDLPGAIADLSEAIRHSTDTASKARAYLNRGRARRRQGDRAGAIADFTEAIGLLPEGADKAKSYNYRGLARAVKGDRARALSDLSEAIRLFPDDAARAIVHGHRALVVEATGDRAAAIADWGEAIRLSPDDVSKARNYYCRGHVRAAGGDHPGAIADYTDAIRLYPANADKATVYGYRASVRSASGDHRGAIADWGEVIRLAPPEADKTDAYFGRACSYALIHRPTEACASLQKAIALDPKRRDMARRHRAFDSIRNHPRFKALIGKPLPQEQRPAKPAAPRR